MCRCVSAVHCPPHLHIYGAKVSCWRTWCTCFVYRRCTTCGRSALLCKEHYQIFSAIIFAKQCRHDLIAVLESFPHDIIAMVEGCLAQNYFMQTTYSAFSDTRTFWSHSEGRAFVYLNPSFSISRTHPWPLTSFLLLLLPHSCVCFTIFDI